MQTGGRRTKGIIKHTQDGIPLITVVTVVRNGEGTLEETIASVINQTYKNIEYIIVDGASTDGTVDIIKKYEDKIDYWMSESDEGIYYAMNKGIDLASGEWINFMNSGDRFYTDETISAIFGDTNSEADVIYGNTYFVHPNYRRKAIAADITTLEKRGLNFCHQSCFVRLALMRGKFNTQYKYMADNEFFYRLYKLNKNFFYKDMIISVYDAYSGFSKLSLKNVLYENYVIRGGKSYTYFYFLNFPRLLRHRLGSIYYFIERLIRKIGNEK